MAIQLNKVIVKIDDKPYEFRKMNFGFQRRMIELQKGLKNKQKELAKKYDVEISELDSKITEDEQLEIAEIVLGIQSTVAELFVKPEDASILDQFDQDNITELITSLQ